MSSRATRCSALLAAAIAASAGLIPLLAAPAQARPTTDYQMPFPCAQSWTGTTRDSHSPSSKAIDWNRPDDDLDPVVASAAGVVSKAVPDGRSGYGRYVVIDHTGGESTTYAHLARVAVTAGQYVDQGMLIGEVGTTGNSIGPHLHFEERRGGDVVTPWFAGQKFTYGTNTSRNCVDVPLAGNFLGGPKAEVLVFRRAARSTFRVQRVGKSPQVVALGAGTDQPVIGDWDGDGRLNPGVRTPSTRTFSLVAPAGTTRIALGVASDVPVAGDWNGDGVWDIGLRRAVGGVFYLRAVDGTLTAVTLGDADDLPVTGDWNGDGATDLGVFDSATATFTLRAVDAGGVPRTAAVAFGRPGDLPVSGDWDANGTTDVGVWTPATATFSLRRAATVITARPGIEQVPFGRRR
ncbi:MAG: VCBS repeat domain-containing M23 family metallopeptidase [Nocardioides sp.]